MQHFHLPKYHFFLLSGLLFFALNLFSQIPAENLQLWLRADSVEITADKVSRWYDLSPNEYPIVQNTEAARPLKIDDALGGQPVIQFNGTSTYLDGGDILDLEMNSHTIFFLSIVNFNRGVFISKSSSNVNLANRYHLSIYDGTFYYDYYDLQKKTISIPNFSLNKYQIVSAVNDRTTSKNEIYINNTFKSNVLINGSHNLNSTYNFIIGAINNSTGGVPPAGIYLNGSIAEIIIYNRLLSEEERNSVETYLMDKYAPPISMGNDTVIEYGFAPIELSYIGEHSNIEWSTGETSATIEIDSSGLYWISGIDIFDRTSSDTIAVTYPSPFITSENTLLCSDSTYQFHTGDFNSTTNYTIEWFNGFVGDTLLISNYAGEVWAKVIDNEAYFKYTDTITVTLDTFKNDFTLGNDTTFCSGNSISLLENPWFSQITNQQWSTGSNENSIPVYTTGNYSVIVQNNHGCSAEDTLYVTIEGIAPVVDFDISGICKASNVTFTNLSSADLSDPIIGQKWYFGSGDSSELYNATYAYQNAGTYDITLEVYAQSGCNNSLIKEHLVRELPTAWFEIDTACSNNQYYFFDQSTPLEETTIENRLWNFGDEATSTETNPTHLYSNANQYTVSLAVTDNYGCADLHDTLLTVVDEMNHPQPFSLISPPNNYLSNNTTVSFSWNSSQDAHLYQLQIALDETFETITLDSTLFENSLTLSLDAAQYFWRVTAKNYCNNGFTSTIHRFTTGILELQTGLIASYSADNGITTNMENRVSDWIDGTGNGFNATQTDDNLKPLLIDNILNGQPALQFAHTNSANYMDFNQMDLSDDNYTIIALLKPEIFDLPVHYLLSGGTPTTSDGGIFTGGTLVQGVGLFDGENTLRGSSNNTNWQLTVLQNDTIFVNGHEVEYGAHSVLNSLKLNLLGSRTNALNTQYFNGYLTDLLIYNTKLTKEERIEIENYLRYKYFPHVNLGSDQLLTCGSCNVTLSVPEYFAAYLWSTGETTASISVSETGNYWVSATDIFGFTSLDTVYIECPSQSCFPKVDLGEDIIVPCGTCNVSLSAQADHFIDYIWSTNETTATIEVNATGTYYVTATDVDGFPTSDSIYVQCPTISCDPGVNLGSDITIAYGFCGVTLDAGDIYSSYLWSTDETSSTIEVTQPGEYYVTVTDQYNYTSSDTIVISYPNISLHDTVLCAGTSAVFSTGLGSDYTYFWSTSSMNETITVSQPSQIWVVVTDSLGCSKTSQSVAIQFDSSANNIAFTINDTALCSGNTVTIDVPETWNYSYLWNTDSTTSSITITESGRYYVTVTSENKCSVVDSIDVSISGVAPVIDFTALGHCINDTLQITDNTYAPDRSTLTKKTWWLTNQGSQITENPQFVLTAVGDSWLTLEAETDAGCSNRDSIQITTDTIPGFTIVTPTTICRDKPALITTTNVVGDIDLWNWQIDNTSFTGEEQTYLYTSSGEQTIRLTSLDLNGCSNTDSVTIDVVEPVIPEYLLELQNPPANYTSATSEITFEWSYQNDTTFTQYKLQIAADNQFETIIDESITSETQLSIDIAPTPLSYWRITGYTLCNDSLTSETRTFQLFAPNQIEGLALWLDAAHATLVEGKVAQWNDLSNNSHSITQTSAASRPTVIDNILGSQPIVRFNGTTTYLDGGDILDLEANSHTIFIVGNSRKSTGTILAKSRWASLSDRYGYFIENGNMILGYHDNLYRETKTSYTNGSYKLFSTTNDRSANTNSLYINSELKSSTTINGSYIMNSSYNFLIGAVNNTSGTVPPYSTYYLDGDIAEIIVYNTLLSEDERLTVENYLIEKYTPTLDLGADIVVDYGFCPIELSIPSGFTDILWSTAETTNTVFINQNGRYWVRAKDNFGRLQTDTINVSYSQPEIADQHICFGDSAIITTVLRDGYSYNWSTGQTADTIYISQAGEYSVQIMDSLGCSATVLFSVTIDTFAQTLSLGQDTTLCAGNSIKLLTGAEDAVSYLWMPGEITNPQIIITESDSYSVAVSNVNGCIGYDTISVAVSGVAPEIDFISENHCFQQPTAFTALPLEPDSIANYTWIFNQTDTLHQSSESYTFAQAGTNNVRLIVESHGACISDTSTTIFINTLPSATFEIVNPCVAIPIVIVPTIEIPEGVIIESFQWFVNSVAISESEELQHTFLTTGDYTLTLRMTTTDGCISDISQQTYIPDNYPLPSGLTLQSPIDDYTTNPGAKTFVWSEAVGSVSYSFELSASALFDDLILSLDNQQNNTCVVTLPNQIPTLYWRVKAFNACGQMFISETRQITVIDMNAIPGLAMWLRADSVELIDGKVSRWNDLSINNYNIQQATATNRPVIVDSVLGSQPVLRFNGSSTYLDGGDIMDLEANSHTIFIVANSRKSTGTIIAKSRWANISDRYGYFIENGNILFGYQDNLYRETKTPYTTGSYKLFSTINNRLESSNSLYINSILKASVAINGSYIMNSSYNFLIGAANNTSGTTPPFSTYYLDGDIAEIIVYNTLLSDEERQSVENYLMNKYTEPLNLGNDIVVDYGFCLQELTIPSNYSHILWSTSDTTQTISISQPGTYWVQATDIFGRVSTDSINVTFPTIGLPSDAAFCLGDTYTAQVTADEGYSYIWSTGETNSEIEISEPGNYWVQISDTLGCSKLHTFTVDVDMYAETMSLGDDRTLCNGNRIELESGAENAETYLWSDGTQLPYFTLNNQSEISVTVTNSNGCIAFDTLNVTIGGTVPNIAFEYTTPCSEQEITFTDNSLAVGNSAINYHQWIFNGTDTLPENSVQYTYPGTGEIDVYFKIGTTEGCSHDTSFQVNVHHTPEVQFIPTAGCERAPVLFQSLSTANDGEIVAWQWSVEETSYSTSGFQHTFLLPGTYPITLEATSEHGCKQSKTENFDAKNAPTANFSVANSCQGTPTLFINRSESFLGSILDYLWTFTPQSQSTATNPEYYFQTTGNYNVSLKATQRLNQCSDTITKMVTISANPTAIMNDTAACAQQQIYLSESSFPGEGATIMSRNWTIDPLFGTINNDLLQTADTAGTFPIKLTVTNSGECNDTVTAFITIHEKPKASIIIEHDTVFVPTTIEAQSEFTNDIYNYRWYLNDSFVAATSSISAPITEAGTMRYGLALETNFGCYDTTQHEIIALIPTVDLEIVSLSAIINNDQLLIRPVLRNNGTIPLSQFLLSVQTDNLSDFQEIFDQTLFPGMETGYTLRTRPNAPETNTPIYICIECQSIQDDQNSENNRQCFLFEDNTRIFTPYPNPATDKISLEVISDIEGSGKISLLNSTGMLLLEKDLDLSRGVNLITLPIPPGATSIIYVKVKANTKENIFNIMINR